MVSLRSILPFGNDKVTIGEERERLLELAVQPDGTRCRCCARKVKVYKRPINSTQARALIKFYNTHGLDWGHLASTAGPACELGKLRYWGLIEEDSNRRADGGRSSWWRVTRKGELYALNRIKVPRRALIYNEQFYGFADEKDEASIKDALGRKFDYDLLMRDEL